MRQKIAIVTGASGNLGQAVVKKFIAEGYYVIGSLIPNDPMLNNFSDDNFEGVVVDLLNESDSGQFVASVIAKFGTIDVAVLTVGGFAVGTIADTSTADIYKQYRLNVETTYNVARPVFVKMLEQNSGRIFLIGSKPGLDAQQGKGMIAYGMAKSLVFRLAEQINEEARGMNVVAAVVVPGTIDTEVNRKAMPDADHSKWVKADEIAGVIHFYATDAASSIRKPVIKMYNGV